MVRSQDDPGEEERELGNCVGADPMGDLFGPSPVLGSEVKALRGGEMKSGIET